MSIEIELKLQLKPEAAARLASHPLLAGLPMQRQRLLNTYYDTPELELHARRIAVRFRKKGWQWLCTVKSAEPACGGLALRSEWECPATPGEFSFAHVDADELRAFLEAASGRFEPVFTTDFTRQLRHVDFGVSRIELAIDRGWIESRGRRQRICEIELELVHGRVEDIFALTRRLQADLNLLPAIASKAERGYELFLDQPARPFRARAAEIEPGMLPVEAFRTIALGCLEHFQRNEPGLQVAGDPEFVHQARVALRRLRSAIRLFAPVLPADFVATYGRTWQTLAGALGEARNWDVFLAESLPPIAAAFPGHPDVRRLQRAAVRRAGQARRTVRSLLAVGEYPRLLVEFTAAIYALGDREPVALAEFAHAQLLRHARQARKLAARHGELDAAQRHRMRIRFKRLRYALEFLASLLPGRRLKPYLAALGQLQDELGLINDHITAQALLGEVLDGRPAGPVHGWIAGRHALLVAELPEALDTWLAQRFPWR